MGQCVWLPDVVTWWRPAGPAAQCVSGRARPGPAGARRALGRTQSELDAAPSGPPAPRTGLHGASPAAAPGPTPAGAGRPVGPARPMIARRSNFDLRALTRRNADAAARCRGPARLLPAA